LSSPVEFSSIVEQYAERIFNHAYRLIGNREDAEEATTDVFVRIHHGLCNFRGDAQLSTWIWRITTNVCLTRRAKKKIQMSSLDAEELYENLADSGKDSNPEDVLVEQEAREELARSIAALPELEAAAITLFYLEGMKYEEIAVTLNLPPGTVATALHRGRERMRKRTYGDRRQL
jgi:RNA polymerase sigma-70 factor (ECF subfamily)